MVLILQNKWYPQFFIQLSLYLHPVQYNAATFLIKRGSVLLLESGLTFDSLSRVVAYRHASLPVLNPDLSLLYSYLHQNVPRKTWLRERGNTEQIWVIIAKLPQPTQELNTNSTSLFKCNGAIFTITGLSPTKIYTCELNKLML